MEKFVQEFYVAAATFSAQASAQKAYACFSFATIVTSSQRHAHSDPYSSCWYRNSTASYERCLIKSE